MNQEQEIKDYLSSLRFQSGKGFAIATDSQGVEAYSIRMHGDSGNNLPETTLIDLLKDEIIRQNFEDYWISMFVQGKSTAGLF
jgi:hypothetical protein